MKSKLMRSALCLPLVCFALFLSEPKAWSYNLENYRFEVSTTALAKLTWDDNTLQAKKTWRRESIQTNRNLDMVFDTATVVNAVVLTVLPLDKNLVDANWGATIQSNQVLMQNDPRRITELLTIFKNQYEKPLEWKKLNPTFYKLVFADDRGFTYTCRLQSRFAYLAIVDIPVSTTTLAINFNRAEFKTLSKFINKIEKDKRASVILENNKSGRPAMISLQPDQILLRHPFHSIIFDRTKQSWRYEYGDLLKDVETLPEIKGLLKNAEVQAFVQAAGGNVQVRMNWQGKKNFDAVLVNRDQGTTLSLNQRPEGLTIKKQEKPKQ